MHKILVTGTNGQLGSELKALSGQFSSYQFIFTDRNSLNLNDASERRRFFEEEAPDVIINCAAYTAVDKAEDEADAADVINHQAVAHLAKIARDKNISLIHISTDYVFDGNGDRPYIETDETAPINMYGKSKCEGEKAVLLAAPKNSIIIRTSWVFSEHGNNFVKTMLKLGREREFLGVIFDQVGTPTYARDLANAILTIIPKLNNSLPEIYHFTNEGETNWAEFAREIFSQRGLNCKVNELTTEQYPTKAKRPKYSVLSKSKIKRNFKLEIRDWREALRDCLASMKPL